jgi:hypothetical protein
MKKMPLSDRHTKTPDNHLIKMKGIKNEIRRNILDDKRRKENSNEDHRHIFDVAIMGAGFAGLSAALLLGRYLLPTVIFDGGKTRIFMTKQVSWLFRFRRHYTHTVYSEGMEGCITV